MEIPEYVSDDEWLARYILYRSHIRRDGSDTIKPDAFIPHPHADLSVTRHVGLSEDRIWKIGQDVAKQRGKTLYGRADVVTSNFRSHKLDVKADPIENNLNHAIISNWPPEKSAQKMIAIEIARSAGKAKLFAEGGSM